MAGHSQFKNIMHRKGAQDAKRAKIFTKLIKEILVAAKAGADPEHNSRLRTAINMARIANVPKDKIANAISRASNPGEKENFEEIRYEAYGPGNVALIIEALTDNRNRTASEVRSALTKCGGHLGESGSVGYLFKREGVIVYPQSVASNEQIFEAAIEANADDCQSQDETHKITCSQENFHVVSDALRKKFGDAEFASVVWTPISTQVVSVEDGEKLLKLFDALEDCDDVQNWGGNYELPESLNSKLKND
jgi:YebC/PmpR family DNA-binding regulatory protein